MYSTSDILGDFAGVNNITTNLTEETETGIRISLHRGVPCSFSVPITFKRLLCRVHQGGGKTLINLTMYLFHTLFLASSLKANSFSLLPAGILQILNQSIEACKTHYHHHFHDQSTLQSFNITKLPLTVLACVSRCHQCLKNNNNKKSSVSSKQKQNE